jgi:cytidyltransferase-like protein
MIKEIKWVVVQWKGHWKTIGFPTANIILEKDIVDDWVYKINIIIDSKIFHWVWSADNKLSSFEAFIFDFNEDIYGKEIEIIILEKIRNNSNFQNKKELREQIEKDVKLAKTKKNYVLTFWTFDLVHDWHKYFLNQAKKYWDILVTILATNENIEKFKQTKPAYDIETRKKQVQNLQISDIIWTWDKDNPLKWIDMYYPTIVCLWYDQIWYSQELENHIKKNKLNIEIIRIWAYKEDIFKSSKLKANNL